MDKINAAVVHLTELGHGVVQITMQDNEAKNTLSQKMEDELTHCFRGVLQNDRYKVVILTGYGNYFASGGTKEQLMQYQRGERSGRTTIESMKLIVDCEIPVIAAMQGHAIGGGFVLGLYADLMVLSRESIYTTNFMKYGFTPGAGATIIVPAKLGRILGQEMLFTARTYRGAELEKRGIGCAVLPRKEVLPHAQQLAYQMAEAPRTSLVNLKKLLTSSWREAFDNMFEKELASFSETIQQPEVTKRINARYGP